MSKETLQSKTPLNKPASSKPKTPPSAHPHTRNELDTIIQRAEHEPNSLTPHDVVQLQRAIGNQAVGQLFARKENGQPSQKEENNTGLPDNLKSGVETLANVSMDDVKVHYNSDKPAQVQAHAYAQGTDIHLASGQEKHLPHEAWHVVQQKQGRVKPTMQMKGNVLVNDDVGLEKEADKMGARAVSNVAPLKLDLKAELNSAANTFGVIQGSFIEEAQFRWRDLETGQIYQQVEIRVDNRLKVAGQGEEFYLEYIDGKWERQQELGLSSGRHINPEKMFESAIPASSSFGGESGSRRKQADPKQNLSVNMEKIHQYLSRYEDKESVSLKTRKQGQRFELQTQGSETLRSQLDSRKKKGPRKQYIDPSYHETVQYIDTEYEAFCIDAEGHLNSQEMRIAYDILLSSQESTVTNQGITATGPAPLTTMTPELLSIYQDMHYRTTLQVEDETASTRAYEAQYTQEVPKRMPMSHWRPFVLPEESSQQESSMVNAIGALLDVQVPTSGNTIGQGKIYSAIYKHFQRSMELLNQHLDKEFGKYSPNSPNAFEERTKKHSEMLDSSFLAGLYENEKEHFHPASGFSSWEDLSQTIDTLVILIAASLDKVPEKQEEDFEMLLLLDDLKGSGSAIVKQFELIGTIIGLMIKKEKRQLLNYQMLQQDGKVKECLENLYELHRVESELNKQLPKSKHNISQLMRREQERRNIGKELADLK